MSFPPGRKWGPLDGSEEWTSNKADRHARYCRVRGIVVDWAEYLSLMEVEKRKPYKFKKPKRVWGPLDGSAPWSVPAAQNHRKYCVSRGITLSWLEYLEVKGTQNGHVQRRLWGPLDGSEEWTRRKSDNHCHFCRARGITLSWAQYLRAVEDEKKARSSHKGPARIWGPMDETWTTNKAAAHRAYCKGLGKEMSWEEYRECVRSRKEYRAKTSEQRASKKNPRRAAILRPASEIVAKILAKVA